MAGSFSAVEAIQCSACGSGELENVLVRAPGVPMVVYARCTACSALVARYTLAGYYHHGRDFESWLRSVAADRESGRNLAADFERARVEAERGFAELERSRGGSE